MYRIAKSLFMILGVIAIAAGATKATWTDQQIISNNTFGTGTLDISATPTSALFNASGIYPGWTETQNLVVTNNGTAPLNYDIVASLTAGSSTLFDSTYFKVKVGTTSGAGDIFGGAAGAPVSTLTGLTTLRSLNAGASETIYITMVLDVSAPNALQGQTATIQFALNATQP